MLGLLLPLGGRMRNVLSTLLLLLLVALPFATMGTKAAIEVDEAATATAPPTQSTSSSPYTQPTQIYIPGCTEHVDHLYFDALWFVDEADARLRSEPFILVDKGNRKAMLMIGGNLFYDDHGIPACWDVALGVTNQGRHPHGAKALRGDRKTPEGWYRTSDKPHSNYHGALYIHYPNTLDAKKALKNEIITPAQYEAIVWADEHGTVPTFRTGLGGDILLHGGGSYQDWTWGCVGFENADIDEMRSLLPEDMRVDILIIP